MPRLEDENILVVVLKHVINNFAHFSVSLAEANAIAVLRVMNTDKNSLKGGVNDNALRALALFLAATLHAGRSVTIVFISLTASEGVPGGNHNLKKSVAGSGLENSNKTSVVRKTYL